MKKLAFVLEIIWLSLAIICLGIGLYTVFSEKATNDYMFFALSAISTLMYLFRRNRRLKDSE